MLPLGPKPLSFDDVTSPLARRVLRALERRRRWLEFFRASTDGPGSYNPELTEYREELRRELAGSGLAQQLLSGLDALPDMQEGLPRFLRGWYRLMRPRSYEQLALHVLRHLEWYLQRDNVPWKPNPALLGCGVCFGLAGLFMLLTAAMLLFGVQQSKALMYLFALCFFLPWIGMGLLILPSLGRHQQWLENRKQGTRLLAFMEYLHESYADAPDLSSGTQMRSAEARASWEADLPEAARTALDARREREG